MPRAGQCWTALEDCRGSRAEPPKVVRGLEEINDKIIYAVRVKWGETGSGEEALSHEKIFLAQFTVARQGRHLRVIFRFGGPYL